MIKLLFVFTLILILAAAVAVRYRRHVQSAIFIWQTFQKMRRLNETPEKRLEKTENLNEVPLVRCAKCGVWIPRNNALNLRSQIFYCSTNCLENAVVN